MVIMGICDIMEQAHAHSLGSDSIMMYLDTQALKAFLVISTSFINPLKLQDFQNFWCRKQIEIVAQWS